MKTAEEICRSRVEPNDLPDYQVLVLDDAVKCAREFAAQEVALYLSEAKANILRSILNANKPVDNVDEWHAGYEAGIHAAIAAVHKTKLIDTTK